MTMCDLSTYFLTCGEFSLVDDVVVLPNDNKEAGAVDRHGVWKDWTEMSSKIFDVSRCRQSTEFVISIRMTRSKINPPRLLVGEGVDKLYILVHRIKLACAQYALSLGVNFVVY